MKQDILEEREIIFCNGEIYVEKRSGPTGWDERMMLKTRGWCCVAIESLDSVATQLPDYYSLRV